MCEPFHTSLVVQKMQRGKKNPHGDEKAPTIKGRGKLSRVGQRYNSALPALQDTGPSTSCLHPSSIARGGSFFGQGPLFGTIHKSPPLCKGSASRGGRGG